VHYDIRFPTEKPPTDSCNHCVLPEQLGWDNEVKYRDDQQSLERWRELSAAFATSAVARRKWSGIGQIKKDMYRVRDQLALFGV